MGDLLRVPRTWFAHGYSEFRGLPMLRTAPLEYCANYRHALDGRWVPREPSFSGARDGNMKSQWRALQTLETSEAGIAVDPDTKSLGSGGHQSTYARAAPRLASLWFAEVPGRENPT